MQYEFDPTEDITAHEIAFLLKIIQVHCPEELYKTLPENVQRHFKETI